MADVVDAANDLVAAVVQNRIASVDLKPEAEATGMCLNECGASLPAGRRWCDDQCRDDWQKARDRGLL
jgi:hypothetical protein